MKEKIKKWKKQLLCMGISVVLGAVAWIVQDMDPVIKEGNVLERPEAEDSYKDQKLYVKGLLEKGGEVPLELRIYPKQNTKEEAYSLYEEILEQIPEQIRGENLSLEDVRTDLDLIAQWPEYGIALSWQSAEPEILENDGILHTEKLEEDFETGLVQKKIGLTVRMSDGNWPEEYSLFVTVKPAVYTEKEQEIRAFSGLVKQEEEAQKESQTFTLPSEYKGKSISYHIPGRPVFIQLCFLGAAAAVLVSLKEKSDCKRAQEDRKNQLLMDYSEMLSRLIIFLGAGMSIRTAWDKIAEDYKRAVKEGRSEKHYVYEEMYITSSQLKSGISETKAFAEFGTRCGLQQYMKLSGLLEQNRKNGSKNLRETLRLEMADAFEQRKHQARRMGEKAGTKLLIPLFLLLGVVMVMIMVPAWTAFG